MERTRVRGAGFSHVLFLACFCFFLVRGFISVFFFSFLFVVFFLRQTADFRVRHLRNCVFFVFVHEPLPTGLCLIGGGVVVPFSPFLVVSPYTRV